MLSNDETTVNEAATKTFIFAPPFNLAESRKKSMILLLSLAMKQILPEKFNLFKSYPQNIFFVDTKLNFRNLMQTYKPHSTKGVLMHKIFIASLVMLNLQTAWLICSEGVLEKKAAQAQGKKWMKRSADRIFSKLLENNKQTVKPM